jgi:hypothetical protein
MKSGDRTYDRGRAVVHTNSLKAIALMRDVQQEAADLLVRAEVDTYHLARLLLMALPHLPQGAHSFYASGRHHHEHPAWLEQSIAYDAACKLASVFPDKVLVTHRYPVNQYPPREHIASAQDAAGYDWYTLLVDGVDDLPCHGWQADGKGRPEVRAARGDYDWFVKP